MVNDVPFSNVSIIASLRGTTLTFDKAQFQQGEGTFNLGGAVDLLTEETNLTAKLDRADVYQVTLAFSHGTPRASTIWIPRANC